MRAFLESRGEIGRDLLEVDWAATPLGPPEDWPQSLQTVVRLVLTSRFSMWMAWGPELTFFCNDAYRRDTLGEKYPWALGRPAAEVWSEIWPDIGPRIERGASTTGEATWDEALHAVPRAQRLPRGDLPHLLLQPARRRRRRDRRHALRGQRGHRGGHRAPPDGDAARPRARAAAPTSTEAETVATACRRARRQTRRSLPFALVYLFDDATGHARGWPARPAFDGRAPGRAPAICRRRPDARRGRSARALTGETVARRRPGRRGSPTCRPGAWDEPPVQALVVPLPQPAPADGRTASWSSALNRYRPLDDGYRDFVDLVAGQLAAGHHRRPRLRGRARPRRDAGRARPGQDRLLHQRQPRVPHAADPAARPGRGRARRRAGARCRPRSASASRSIQRNGAAAAQAGQHACSTSPGSSPAASRPRFEPVDLAALHRRAGQHVRRRPPTGRASR